MLELIRRIANNREESGASAVEYGLLVAGIAALIVTVVFLLGGQVQSAFQTTCNTIKQGSSATAATC